MDKIAEFRKASQDKSPVFDKDHFAEDNFEGGTDPRPMAAWRSGNGVYPWYLSVDREDVAPKLDLTSTEPTTVDNLPEINRYVWEDSDGRRSLPRDDTGIPKTTPGGLFTPTVTETKLPIYDFPGGLASLTNFNPTVYQRVETVRDPWWGSTTTTTSSVPAKIHEVDRDNNRFMLNEVGRRILEGLNNKQSLEFESDDENK